MELKQSFKLASGQKNNPEIEKEYRTACSWYESQQFTPDQIQDYQEYVNNYHKITSLYLFANENELLIYDTENETEEVKILETKESFFFYTCITQLPNGELFCFGDSERSGVAIIVTKNYEVKVLPPGIPCGYPSGIYYNNNIYFFGGLKDTTIALSSKFDLNQNRWTSLANMPNVDAQCHIVIFNEKILISGSYNTNILIYSIDIDSFSKIPYDFQRLRRKILINVERLYLIECLWGLIYESEIGDEYSWKQISNSMIKGNPYHADWAYNKGAIYIAADFYYKFDLNKKNMIKLFQGAL